MTLFGPDVSVYQVGITLTERDWDIDFLIARCIHRGTRVDAAFDQFRDRAKDRGVPFGAYAFVRPLSMIPVRRQVDMILTAMGDDPVPVWFDHERDGTIPALSDHDLLELGGACADAGLSVPTLYTGWHSDSTPFTPTDLAFLGYDGVINARYPRQSDTTPPRGDHVPWYNGLGGDEGKGWDYDPGPAISAVPVLVWQYSSACTWGDFSRVDWNAIRDPAVIAECFETWTPTVPDPEPVPPPTQGDDDMPWIIAKNADNGDSWEASPDGRSRLHVPSQVDAAVVFAKPAWDPIAKQWRTSYDPVASIPAAQVTAKLGPRAR